MAKIGTALARFDWRELAAVFAGGALGTVARAEIALALPYRGGWPLATFAVNIAGAFALGYFATRLQERLPLSAYRRPLLGTGLCGGTDDVLDDAAGAAEDARSGRCRPRGRATRSRASLLGFLAVATATNARAQCAGARVSATVFVCVAMSVGRRVARLLLGRRGVAIASAAGSPGDAVGQRERPFVLGLLSARRSSGNRSCSPVRDARVIHDLLHLDVREPSPGEDGQLDARSSTSCRASRSVS